MSSVHLWEHRTHQPGPDYASIGVLALINDHDRLFDLFEDCLKAYVESGLYKAVSRYIRRMEVLARSKENSNAQEPIFSALVKENQEQIHQRPLVLADLFQGSYLQEGEAAWEAIRQQYPAPEFGQAVEALANCPALGGSDAAKAAIEWCVGGVVHKGLLRKAWESIQTSPLTLAVLIGDRGAKVKQRTQRKIVNHLRKLLRDSDYSWKQGEGLWRNAQRWAAVWEKFDGRPTCASQSDSSLFTGLLPKKISEICSPSNQVFGVRFHKGAKPQLDYSPRPQSYVPANRKAGRFR